MNRTMVLLMAGTALLLGCSKSTDSYRFEIKSDTSWTATYGQVGKPDSEKTVLGASDKTINVSEAPPVCIIVGNLETTGTIKVSAIKHVSKNGGPFHSDDETDIVQDTEITRDPTGETGACTQ